ncbi:bifunctional phosphoribosyl-AMP cyclohydrolase/phosphoribosyl-ATP diphosphatase HisIE [Clostridium cylindrosporum]|uniref:Histidine biosynthesis bifunctional protein HisIE n=1 Tax=Clostridium cylindrosporum DSM 605 TaxID=1121307 RepID=A0A0J8DEH1_CLOCY|nr:bifunctional phosphoribosyl-AMP cyclohydrolase/phosphoribosyl-ATP diphosphatase HisIE [Clostridium cylindrosporum]KMT22588.1 histidine biosynthesis bifunctional protein HisIE [Clostridium cylindrosporum DSM 605]
MEIKYDANGLVPAVIQCVNTGKVLMLGYMNSESLEKTIETKNVWFYSRSRQKLWMKGETSGNIQVVKSIKSDCDNDALLIEVESRGPICHTGNSTCFFNEIEKESEYVNIVDELYKTIVHRKENPVEGSYTNYLFDKGVDKILKKVGEETSEVIIGAKNDSKEEMSYEISDLIYHLLVLMVDRGVKVEDIKAELLKRFK